MIVDFIKNRPYIRRLIATSGEPDLLVPVPELFYEQTDEELIENDIKRMDADYQAIQNILLGLPEDVYAAVDKNIVANLKFCNNLQSEWKRHVTIVRQTKNLHEADFTQIYDFLKMNRDEVNELRAERLAKTHDPLALMAHSQNSYNFLVTHNDQSSSSTHSQQSFTINNKTSSDPRNCQIAQPGMNMSQDIQIQNDRGNVGNQFRQYAGQVAQNQQGYMHGRMNGTGNIIAARADGTRSGNQSMCYNCRGLGHIARNCIARPRIRDVAYLQTQLLIAQKKEARIQIQAKEFDFMAAAGDLDEINEVNTNCILMANLQHASTSGTQLDKALIYDTNGSAEVQLNDICYDNEIFNMFTQEEQYTDLLEPIPEPKLVPQNDNLFTSVASTKFVRDFKSLANEADESLDKQKFLELKIKRLLKASVSHDIISIVQNGFVDVPSDLRTDLDRTNEKHELCIIKRKKNTLFYGIIGISVTPHVYKPKLIAVTPHSKKLHASILSHSVPQPRESNVVKHKNVIAHEMFKIDPSQTSRVDLVPNNQASASIRTNPITNFHRHVSFKENASSDIVNAFSTGLVHTARSKRPQPKGNSRNARVPSASKSSEVKKNATVEGHRRILLLSKNQKTMSFECNNIKLAIRNDKSKIVCGTCKQCLVTANHEACLLSLVNALNSCANNIGTVRFGNDHIAVILGYGNLKWGNITIIRVYFVEGLGHNLFVVGQFCDADLEVAFRRNTCFIRDLDGFDLLKGNCSTNLYTINLYDMASASLICLMARATPTKSWLWHQRLSYLNFDTINDLAKNDIVSSLPKFKYAKEHLCPFCEQGKSKRASHPPKPVLNSKQKLHLLHMDLFDPITKDEMPKVIKNFLKKIYVRLQAPVVIVRTDNETELKNHILKEYFDSVGITHETSAAKTLQQNRVVECRNRIVYNQRTKKIMETMNVTFDELSAMAFEQNSSKPGLQSLTSGQNSFELELTYAPSTITP
nr:retrovirus-related Pol polyprotein from transposon TNT 1-94 [Tanacetum cinerariifolium]